MSGGLLSVYHGPWLTVRRRLSWAGEQSERGSHRLKHEMGKAKDDVAAARKLCANFPSQKKNFTPVVDNRDAVTQTTYFDNFI